MQFPFPIVRNAKEEKPKNFLSSDDKKVLKIEENNKKIIISFVDETSASFLGQYDLKHI